jgi:hypothetical protein
MTSEGVATRRATLRAQVEQVVARTPVIDIHTHLYEAGFGDLLLWGIDDLLVYHYLVAEAFRYLDRPYEEFWAMPKSAQAELIWKELFLKRSPVSESCRGVLTTLNELGLDPRSRDLPSLRRWFAEQKPGEYVDLCLEKSGVKWVYMTNSPFDDQERRVWEQGLCRDERFHAALRIDPLLLSWEKVVPRLAGWGYEVRGDLSGRTVDEVRRFLADWSSRIKARFVMVSLPPDWVYPANNPCNQLMERAVLPHCRDHGQPFAMMPGVIRGVNPGLALAGDGVGLTRLSSLGSLCARFQENRFMATVLARENQHELCVLARKFRNLHIFGCWWFLNVPHLVDEITRMRVEMLGLSVTLQHSDARVLDQLIYKWRHAREVIGRVLADKYEDLLATGWEARPEEIERDVRQVLGGDFERFCGSAAG